MQVFVGVLGASGYIYCEAHRSQSLPNWIRAHVHMFAFFGGVPRIVRPDNLKAGVKKACFYEPDINPTYHELAQHYNLAVIPARVAKPQDKGLIYLMLFSLRTPIFGALGLILFRGLDALKAPLFAEYQNKQISSHNRATVLSIINMFAGAYTALMGFLIGMVAEGSLTGAFLFMGCVIVFFTLSIFIMGRKPLTQT